MKTTILSTAMALSLSVVSGTAAAADPALGNAAVDNTQPSYASEQALVPNGAWGGGGWGWGYHSSTAAEGYLRGWGDVVRSSGEYNYLTSLAAINGQIARSQALDNQLKQAETYFEKKQVWADYMAAQRGPRPTVEDLQRYARASAPQRLNSYQIERVSGRIHWPAALAGQQFAAPRAELDALFASREVAHSGVGSDNYRQVTQITKGMLAELKSQIGQMTPAEYIQSKNFLQGLALEAHQGAAVEGLVIR